MKKLLLLTLLVLMAVVSSCTIFQVKKEKELKYPEWAGLDEKIREYEEIIETRTEENFTSFYRLGVKPEYIKWHFCIFINKKDSVKVKDYLKENNFIIYKETKNPLNYEELILYIRINNPNSIKENYNLLKGTIINKLGINTVSLNPLIEYSTQHYRPINIKIIGLVEREYSEDSFNKYAEKYDITIRDIGLGMVWYNVPENVDFVKLYVDLFDEPEVEYVFLDQYAPIIVTGEDQ